MDQGDIRISPPTSPVISLHCLTQLFFLKNPTVVLKLKIRRFRECFFYSVPYLHSVQSVLLETLPSRNTCDYWAVLFPLTLYVLLLLQMEQESFFVQCTFVPKTNGVIYMFFRTQMWHCARERCVSVGIDELFDPIIFAHNRLPREKFARPCK